MSICIWTHPKKGERAGNRRKRHLDSPSGKSKTCLIHGPVYSSEECKVLGDFETKYANIRPNKDRGSNPVPRGEFNRQMENNDIVNKSVGEILLTENQKLSAAREAPEFLDSDYDENDVYQVDKMSLEDTKEKL